MYAIRERRLLTEARIRVLTRFLYTCFNSHNPRLWVRFPPHARLNKSSPPARLVALAGGQFVGQGYLVMIIYPLTMAGLIPLPKQCSHVNQSTYALLCHCAGMQNFNMPTWDGWAY